LCFGKSALSHDFLSSRTPFSQVSTGPKITGQVNRRNKMDEGKFVADFVAHNFEKICALGGKVFGVADEVVQVRLKTAYTTYLSKTREKYSKSKSFFIRHEPVDLYSYYVPTGIRCGTFCLPKPSFRELVQHSSRVVITGSGGSGKSILMKHLFLDCIADKTYAPVLIELRDLNTDTKSIDEFVIQTLEIFGFDTSGDYVKRAKKAGHFCFFFDGYDEVTPSLREKVISNISSLSKKFPDCPIILSSRPDDTISGIEDFSIFRMQALSLDSAVELVEKLPFDEDVKSKFSKNLMEGLFEQHKSFLSNPLLLSIMLLTYGENAEIPSKLSIFYNQAYEALFQRHDANKGGYTRKRLTSLDIQDFGRVFSLFALQTYEKRLFKMARTQCIEFIEKSRSNLGMDFRAEDYLSDLIAAACLLVEDGLEIAFSHRSFQEYFVALQISNSPPDIQSKLIDRYWPNMASDNVMSLLLEINANLVERELILPKLEKLFSFLGVKRKVGITHATKHIKKTYSEICIDDEYVRATILNPKSDLTPVLHLAVKHCGNFKFQDKQYYDKFRDALLKKYGEIEVKTSELTSRSPLLLDMFSGFGVFSVEYLNEGFDAYKTLKQKHANYVQNLDALLGIR
jgi:hypothetical protein